MPGQSLKGKIQKDHPGIIKCVPSAIVRFLSNTFHRLIVISVYQALIVNRGVKLGGGFYINLTERV